MTQNIQFSGLSSVPADFDCADGTLAYSLNLLAEDGEIKPLPQPGKVADLADYTLLGIHKLPVGTELLILAKASGRGTYNLHCIDRAACNANTPLPFIAPFGTGVPKVQSFATVGNILILSTSQAMLYYYWKDTAYICLGDHIPDISIRFALHMNSDQEDSPFNRNEIEWGDRGGETHPSTSVNGSFPFDIDTQGSEQIEIIGNEGGTLFILTESWYNSVFGDRTNDTDTLDIDENIDNISNAFYALINKKVATAHNGNLHIFPFLVRYTIRMYDGTEINHSAPVMLDPCNKLYFILKPDPETDDNYGAANPTCRAHLGKLHYARLMYSAFSDDQYLLPYWKDLIESVEFYITKPIYPYDAAKQLKYYTPGLRFKTSQKYAVFEIPKCKDTFNEVSSVFYRICSIPIDELKFSDQEVYLLEDSLYSLNALYDLPVMPHDANTRDLFIPTTTYNHNNRLVIANASRRIFPGFDPACIFAPAQSYEVNVGVRGRSDIVEVDSTDCVYKDHKIYSEPYASQYSPFGGSVTADYYIKASTGSQSVTLTKGSSHASYFRMCLDGDNILFDQKAFFYHPSPHATEIGMRVSVVYPASTTANPRPPSFTACFKLPLRPHDFLSGCYAYIDAGESIPTITNVEFNRAYQATGNQLIIDKNVILWSETNNPFLFQHSTTVGATSILKLATATKALSQGQFGQFPLYAFTDEGIWALETSGDGSYSARQPITRDVCINHDSVTQLDSSVAFASARGIMVISGSQVECISLPLNADRAFNLKALPGIADLHTMIGHGNDNCLPLASFEKYLKSCSMLYDYPYQRIIVFSPRYKYAYVYSLRSQQWGMMNSNFGYPVNSYPEALVVDTDNNILDFSKRDIASASISPHPSPGMVDPGMVDPGIVGPGGQEVDVAAAPPPHGLLVTRPLKLGAADSLKTVTSLITRGTFKSGHVKSVLYGSRDLIHWYPVWSSKDHYLRGFRGTPYKYYRLALVTSLSEGETIFCASVEADLRLSNRPR